MIHDGADDEVGPLLGEEAGEAAAGAELQCVAGAARAVREGQEEADGCRGRRIRDGSAKPRGCAAWGPPGEE